MFICIPDEDCVFHNSVMIWISYFIDGCLKQDKGRSEIHYLDFVGVSFVNDFFCCCRYKNVALFIQ